MQVKPLMKDEKNFPIIADPKLNGEYPNFALGKALKLASMCLKEDAKKRPAMTEVVLGMEYVESQKYHNPNKDTKMGMEVTSMLNTKGKEPERAVDETKVSRNKGTKIASS